MCGDDSNGHRGEAISALRRALKDEDASVRLAAAEALGTLARPGRPAAEDLTTTLGDDDQNVRFAAARALLRVGEGTEAALRTLSDLLADPALVPARNLVTQAMTAAGAPGEDALLRVIGAMLADPDEGARLDAVDVLPALGSLTARISLEPLWASPDPRVRFTAALAAERLAAPGSTPDPRMAPALEAAVLDASHAFSLRGRALDVLYGISPATLRHCGRELARQLDLDDDDARLAAANLLHMIDPETLAGKPGR